MNNGAVEGVPLREYVELLVDAKTNEIKVVMAERMEAVHTAEERHAALHRSLEKDMEHLNALRQEVISDRDRFVPVAMFREFRGYVFGGIAVLAAAFGVVQGVIAYYGG